MTILPLCWLTIVALTGGWEKIFSEDIKIGFLSHATWVGAKLAQGVVPPGVATAGDASRMMFNDRLDAAVVALFMISVIVILIDSTRVWVRVINGTEVPVSSEAPFTPRTVPAES